MADELEDDATQVGIPAGSGYVVPAEAVHACELPSMKSFNPGSFFYCRCGERWKLFEVYGERTWEKP